MSGSPRRLELPRHAAPAPPYHQYMLKTSSYEAAPPVAWQLFPGHAAKRQNRKRYENFTKNPLASLMNRPVRTT